MQVNKTLDMNMWTLRKRKDIRLIVAFITSLGVTIFAGSSLLAMSREVTEPWRFWFLLTGFLIFLVMTLLAVVNWVKLFVQNKNRKQLSLSSGR